jgi:tripeptidyl-peptidase-1
MRTVPDVAMAAADHDGYVMVENGSCFVVAGTSASSPSFAGVMALVVQKQGGAGQGSPNPKLYALAKSVPNAFHATPSGNNTVPGVDGFTANGASYNLATGLGSVDGAVLAGSWGEGSILMKPWPIRAPVRNRCARCAER